LREFVSEAIEPRGGTFDTTAMGRGEPGLPAGFTWRDVSYDVDALLGQWKQSGPEKGRRRGERYLRRHVYRLRMSDGAVWTVYFTRQPSGGGRQRWFLYEIDDQEGA
jgi:hypothetical protein